MRARWIRILGFWTLLGLLSSVQVYLAHRRLTVHPFTWAEALRDGLAFWYLWALAAPAVAWLGRRFQVDRANLSRHFIIHLGASLDLALLHLVAFVAIQRPPDFTMTLVDDFTLFFHWNILIYWAIVAIVHAFDYHQAMEQGAGSREQKAAPPQVAERLLVADNGRSFFVRTADIEWIEAARNYVRVHNNGHTYLVRTTLAALEARLDRAHFRRVGRSALVNLDRVREIQPWFHGDAIVILQSGAQVTLSRRYRSNLLDVAGAGPG
jgi:LytTr DNA-binding domain-containing protein